MKKKIASGIVATLFVAGAVVFGAGTMKKSSCPDRPGCICAKHMDVCTNRPLCACTK
jgi:uncharacterized protein (DUF1499 family)